MPLLALSTFTYGQTKTDEAQINKILDGYMAVDTNTKKLNFDVLLSNSTEDASWVNIVGMHWKGRETMRKAFHAMFEERDMFKNVPFEKKSTTIRFVTPDVAIASVVTHVGEFFPPDGVNRGFNVNPAADEMGTMVFVKKNGKWLFTSGQNTVVDARAVDPMK
ncbi:SgcJ/EcaC family oxidoreductase [Hymenobacter sediminicola]|uniref:SgcJ/EcaC family oxidoreductase n=1 Tax=Hymenobacter sediminicola TaxID=2761579 RepID=A0A7G7WAE4_9BACT|nr:SgcJ/EcaC family oxidoreductase [Hymenobacter sediminicola]QNH63337.1 SgcJ/EcaC family oxidoreductase [Hymenobacter sediminicola]